MLAMLTKVLRLQILIFSIVKYYVCYIMLHENSKTTAYIKHVDTTAKNTAKNELQYLSNKTDKQKYIY